MCFIHDDDDTITTLVYAFLLSRQRVITIVGFLGESDKFVNENDIVSFHFVKILEIASCNEEWREVLRINKILYF